MEKPYRFDTLRNGHTKAVACHYSMTSPFPHVSDSLCATTWTPILIFGKIELSAIGVHFSPVKFTCSSIMALNMESLAEATSGAIGSLLSTTILYPLDTCKTKYQAELRAHGLAKYRCLPF